jgi:hypothetical protein
MVGIEREAPVQFRKLARLNLGQRHSAPVFSGKLLQTEVLPSVTISILVAKKSFEARKFGLFPVGEVSRSALAHH